jgi:DNA-binding HxlR family transcriptional regulator
LNLVGERWALLVVRELVLGPKRFTDLQAGLPGAGPNVLAQRLHGLEAVGVIQRAKLPPPAASRVYELTRWGAELEPILLALARWGSASPVVPPAGDVGSDSLMLGLRGRFSPQAARNLTARYEIRLGDDTFTVGVTDGHVDVTRGRPLDATVVVETDRVTFLELLDQGGDVLEMVARGRVVVRGDVNAVARLFAAANQREVQLAQTDQARAHGVRGRTARRGAGRGQ